MNKNKSNQDNINTKSQCQEGLILKNLGLKQATKSENRLKTR